MKLHRCCGLVVLLLTFVGCGSDKQGPTGAVYEGKHVSEWGDIAWEAKDPADRLRAARVLAKLGKEGISGKEAINNLHKATANDEDPSVRGWAAVALVYAAQGTPFPIGQVAGPVLKEAAESSDEELRAEASQMVTRMRSAAAGPPGGPGGKRGAGKGPPADKKQPPDDGKGAPPPDKGKGAPPEKDKSTPPPDKDKSAPPPEKGAPPHDKGKS
jgi:hypothetical protein